VMRGLCGVMGVSVGGCTEGVRGGGVKQTIEVAAREGVWWV
jgi:hypothetical protein